ncbi:MAG TPA: matrixin family metalloprotease [Vicinamibacteria bacterium]|nr:matrixin family metalloprotease [Vicinamibacteria bacterium]
MRRLLLPVALLSLLSACGGGTTTTTAPSAPTQVLDGITGAPVPGEPLEAAPGDRVRVQRAGYLRRDTIVPSDRTITLWPMTVDEAFVRTLVYGEVGAGHRLHRWATDTVPVARDFPAEVIEAVRPWVDLVPSDQPRMTIVVDPGDPLFAQFTPDTIGVAFREIAPADARIVSVRLVFRSADAVRLPGSLLHEVGHGLGLSHSPRRQDLMFPSTARTTTVFSADERVLLSMMYDRRRPGQVAPDDDQALGPAQFP